MEQIVEASRSSLLGCVRPRAAYAESPTWQECVHVELAGLHAVPLVRILVELALLVMALVPVVEGVTHHEVHAAVAVQAGNENEAEAAEGEDEATQKR